MHAETRIPRSHEQASTPFGKTAARSFFSGLGSNRPAAPATPAQRVTGGGAAADGGGAGLDLRAAAVREVQHRLPGRRPGPQR